VVISAAPSTALKSFQKTFKARFKAEAIHGNKNHSQRQRALGAFKTNKANILVATDVAARGLDIPASVTSLISNFLLPTTITSPHRKNGRSNKKEKH